MKKALFTLLAACTISLNSYAQTLQLDAVVDFERLDEGAAPYYVDTARVALAINASNTAFRDVFARATTTFSGAAGSYDVTIAALGEEDGNCQYRFFVNDTLIGTAANHAVEEDYEVQLHKFESVNIPAGAELSVESNAVTNGLIPEGNGTAYARGRWRTLTLEAVAAPQPDPLDLAVSTSVNDSNPAVNQEFVLRIEVQNTNAGQTATAPVITMPVPANTVISAHALCDTSTDTVRCELAEISAGDVSIITMAASATSAGTRTFVTTVNADQTDDNSNNNTSSIDVTVADNEVLPATVDLNLTVNSNANTITDGQTIEYELTVLNQHTENTATAPKVAVVLPAGLSFAGSADCSASGQAVSCELAELAPQASTSVSFTAQASQAGTAQIIATTSANEADSFTADNEVLYNVQVSARATTDNTTTDNNGSTGTGAIDFRLLLMMLIALCCSTLRHRQVDTPQR